MADFIDIYDYDDIAMDVVSNGDNDSASAMKMSANDAYIYSMRNKARVDLDYMSSISGLTKEALVDALKGVIFPDPKKYEATEDFFCCFTSKQQYLRGNLIKKYTEVRELNEKYGGLFNDTVELLNDSLPDKVDASEIHMGLGSSWIPPKYIADFVQKLLGMSDPPRVDYNATLGKWSIETVSKPNYVNNEITFGTSRMSAIGILKHILNAKPVKVFDQVYKKGYTPESVLNQPETLAAQHREKLIIDAWNDYIHTNSRIEQSLQEVYLESYGYPLCKYDGSFLDLPGLNPGLTPYKHQLDAIARIALNNNSLLAHEVGSGKTLEYMAGIHELLRLGLGHKAMIVVPNNTFESTVNTYKELYSEDHVLAVYPRKNWVPDKRSQTIARIKSNEYQVVVMTYSSFDMLTLTPVRRIKNKCDELSECLRASMSTRNYSTMKALQSRSRKLEKDIQKLKENLSSNNITACFDELGVDILVVDECHNYKNITLSNMTDSIVGVHNIGSKKADNMLEKVEFIQSLDGHVIFATGTPITNSLADLYVIQRYLQPGTLKACNIFHFNDWINTFCSQTQSFEVDVDTKNYRFTTRFSKFHNLPELMALCSDVIDFYQIGNGELGLPRFNGYTDSLIKKSVFQKKYIDILGNRTEAIRAHEVSRKEDNLLKIVVEGRMCALDPRLVIKDLVVGSEDSKVKTCADRIASVYFGYPGTTQIAFCDISTPKDSFNIYDELKSELILRGIPDSEIAFIHDATTESKRNRMEKRFNAGEIRILIGSTMKLGTGCNVQERLKAVHHLDVPWRPSDVTQREGRIIRQGNTNSEVFIYRYVTEASFDAYIWQILENKQRFISQFLSGSLSGVHRDESDCGDTVLDYAEIKALAIGNPLIKERVEVSNQLEHAKINSRQKTKNLLNLQCILVSIPGRKKTRESLIKKAKMDQIYYSQYKQSIPREERLMFGEELLNALKNNVLKDEERIFDTYQGFKVILPSRMLPERPQVILSYAGTYTVDMDGDKPLGVCQRLDYALDHLQDTIRSHEDALLDLEQQRCQAQADIDKGNEFEPLVETLTKRLEEIDKLLKVGE